MDVCDTSLVLHPKAHRIDMKIGGQPNMYMQNHRCKVTGSTSTKTLGTPKPPVYCEDDLSKCVKGPKQMMAWNRKYLYSFLIAKNSY